MEARPGADHDHADHDHADHGHATVTDVASASPPLPAASAGLRPGDILAGRYRIERFIAGGGMGEVYQAEDALLRDQVAVKLLRAELLRKPNAQDRFAEEIRMARRVTHPNVCRVFDVGVDGDRVFFTMELHSGATLATKIAESGGMAGDAAAPLIRQLLAGTIAAHDAGIVHLDLKPSNALLAGAQHDRVVLTDFGLAMPCCAELGCACRMPHMLGTPAYMSPEQLEGGMALERTDVFALGVILYEMLTGQQPYRGENADAIARARLAGDPPSPRAARDTVSEEWDRIIRACLARDPKARPCNAREVAGLLGLA